jgi:signal transduction histidine kinase
LRISYKVWLVGGIPIAIAAAIAVVAWLLLKEGERARDGAVLAGTIYRNLVVAITARDDYMQALPGDRAEHAVRFGALAEQTGDNLKALAALARDQRHRGASVDAGHALARYAQQMRQFMVVTTQNDHMATEMRDRVASLVALTDRARARQHASNVDIVTSLKNTDRTLRVVRDLVDKAYGVRAEIAATALLELRRDAGATYDAAAAGDWQLTLALARLRRSAEELSRALTGSGEEALGRELTGLVDGYESLLANPEPPAGSDSGNAVRPRSRARQQLTDWADRLLKVKTTEQNARHEEVAQLMTYSVQANETEQATQNVAIETLKLGQRTSDALTKRDPAGAEALLAEGRDLSATIDALPISPLIQSEMMEALEQWRARLTTAVSGLRTQNEMIAAMDTTAGAMVAGARELNDLFGAEASRIGDFVRKMLLLGATVGLLLGSGTAFVVARSITRPLAGLQRDMRALAQDPAGGSVGQTGRSDELGDMARAANFFVGELGHREAALRDAKEQADAALAALRRTQADLIQSEKLASLGQIVAGVAHEINTPVGIALTTATTLSDEVKSFSAVAEGGQVPRQRFLHFLERVKEGSELLFANLTRAAVLVQSFKQVAADQVSSERRSFAMDVWARELLVSLQPVLRRSSHAMTLVCPPAVMLDSYPGALAQVLTNLIMNALSHAYAPGAAGNLRLAIASPEAGRVRVEFSDDGRGIAPENLGKVFDPFFTTARNRGNTGLGLHIAFNLVTGPLEGKIDVRSRPGEGTRFIITLPTRISAASHVPAMETTT